MVKILIGWSDKTARRLEKVQLMFGEISPRTKAAAPFISVEEALEETRRGHMVILMDDEQRENEGDLSMAAEKATPELINFMAKHARGLICLPMSTDRIEPPRPEHDGGRQPGAARHGVHHLD